VRSGPQISGSFAISDERRPIAGVNFPTDADEAARMFGDDARCLVFMEALRYPRGFVCRKCSVRAEPWRSGTGIIACRDCRAPVQLKAESLFAGSHISLRRWFRLLWAVCDGEAGVSAQVAQDILEVGGETAAAHLAQLRAVMARETAKHPLSGVVHVAGTRLTLDDEEPIVAIALRDEGDRGRLRVRHLPQVTTDAMTRFVVDGVARGSLVHTPPRRGFAGLARAGFGHRIGVSPALKGVASLLRLWLWNAPDAQGAHLQAALDEFCFRYDRRHYQRGLLFHRMAILAVVPEQTSADQSRAAG
jgi:hypothetical protein